MTRGWVRRYCAVVERIPREEGAKQLMTTWDRETDLLVFGSGAAGMTAALVAAKKGLKVILCEKTDAIGGTTATSAGTVWIPGNTQSIRAGIEDSRERIHTYLQGEIGPRLRRNMIDAFLEYGPEAIDFLEQNSEVRFETVRGNPDYHSERAGGASAGRALAPLSFDGRSLGRDFTLLRPPRSTLMIFGGMMVGRRELPDLLRPFASTNAFRRVSAMLLRHARDRLSYPRGTRLLLGNALVARFLVSLREAGVEIRAGCALADLVPGATRIEGAIVAESEAMLRIRARRGVVLATGGFPGSPSLVSRYIGDKASAWRCYAYPESVGEGMAAALRVGAAADEDMNGVALWTPVSVLKRRDGSEALWAHHSLDRAKPGLIAINAAGRRFVNEGDSYHDFVLAMLRSHTEVPTIPAFLVCDRNFVRRYGLGMIRPRYHRLSAWTSSGYVKVGATIADLASAIGVDAMGLAATVAENNRFAETGVDSAFGKGSRPLNVLNGDPDHRPNPCLGPIASPPFVALPVYPGIIGTVVGVEADADARALDSNGHAIEGLYVCGNDSASIFRGAYPGPGIGIGPAITFAYRAASHAAAGP